MNRRLLLRHLGMALCLPLLTACAKGTSRSDAALRPRLEKSSAEWRELLGEARYRVLFEEATERPWSSPLNDETRDGSYVCAACHLPLFESAHKYDSGTGWPSFTQPIPRSVGTRADYRLFFPRTEYHCIRCGGHQGHVFEDGPEPRGERWCNNGLALLFIPEGEAPPALRS